MAGLIWLWQNIQNVPPVVIYTDVGISPVMVDVVDNSPSLSYDYSNVKLEFIESLVPLVELQDNKPIMGVVDKTSSVLTTTTTTYNQSGVSYNGSSQVYGGSGKSKDPAPQFYKVGNK